MKNTPKKKSVKSRKNNAVACLQSRPVLYLTLTVALFNLFGYLMTNQLDAVAIFVISGFGATMFSKNMIVVLLSAMSVSLLLVLIKYARNSKEGMEDKDGKDKDGKDKDGKDKDGNDKDGKDKDGKDKDGKDKDGKDKQTKPVKTDGFEQKITPSNYGNTEGDDTTDPKNSNTYKPKVDYISTIESAYDNLDKFLSSDAIKNMTEDTAKLAEKQQQLVGNLEKIGPIMDKAGNILDKMPNIEKMTGMMGGIQDKFQAFRNKNKGAQ